MYMYYFQTNVKKKKLLKSKNIGKIKSKIIE